MHVPRRRSVVLKSKRPYNGRHTGYQAPRIPLTISSTKNQTDPWPDEEPLGLAALLRL